MKTRQEGIGKVLQKLFHKNFCSIIFAMHFLYLSFGVVEFLQYVFHAFLLGFHSNIFVIKNIASETTTIRWYHNIEIFATFSATFIGNWTVAHASRVRGDRASGASTTTTDTLAYDSDNSSLHALPVPFPFLLSCFSRALVAKSTRMTFRDEMVLPHLSLTTNLQ